MNATLEAEPITQDQDTEHGPAVEITIDTLDVTKHNGEITVFNPATGDHRTFRISTCLDGNLKGKRILALLTGSCNEADYQGFAFVDDFGIQLWRRFRSTTLKPTAHEVFAKILSSPVTWAKKRGLSFQVSGRCRKCNRLLTHPESIASGLGPVCATKF